MASRAGRSSGRASRTTTQGRVKALLQSRSGRTGDAGRVGRTRPRLDGRPAQPGRTLRLLACRARGLSQDRGSSKQRVLASPHRRGAVGTMLPPTVTPERDTDDDNDLSGTTDHPSPPEVSWCARESLFSWRHCSPHSSACSVSAPAPRWPRASRSSGSCENPEGKELVPVEGVKVMVKGPGGINETATTDENGRWTVEANRPGTFTVTLDQESLPKGVTLRNPDADPLKVPVAEGQDKPVLFALGESTPPGPEQVGAGRSAHRRGVPVRPDHRARRRRPVPHLRHDRADQLRARRAGHHRRASRPGGSAPGRCRSCRLRRHELLRWPPRSRWCSWRSSAGPTTPACGGRCAAAAPA